ncbi:sulfite exporter TauE/SafE family protein [bacterium]|nr:sulfite exporter TauE/SafE family protein [bacterium]
MPTGAASFMEDLFTTEFLLYLGVGFLAQFVDGVTGMAHSVIANSFLLSLGIPPAQSSASVHATRTLTSLASALSHFRLGNIEKGLIKRLLITGMLGGVVGVLLIGQLPGHYLTPFVALYLLFVGGRLLWKTLKKREEIDSPEASKGLALHSGIGGFLDSLGGGGWGPIVTGKLLSDGYEPAQTVGTVNLVKFFITAVQTVAFIVTIGIGDYWRIILGLIIGGILAAPPSAMLCKKLPSKWLLVGVGILIMALSLRTLLGLLL